MKKKKWCVLKASLAKTSLSSSPDFSGLLLSSSRPAAPSPLLSLLLSFSLFSSLYFVQKQSTVSISSKFHPQILKVLALRFQNFVSFVHGFINSVSNTFFLLIFRFYLLVLFSSSPRFKSWDYVIKFMDLHIRIDFKIFFKAKTRF